jgi:hypothetical protein
MNPYDASPTRLPSDAHLVKVQLHRGRRAEPELVFLPADAEPGRSGVMMNVPIRAPL